MQPSPYWRAQEYVVLDLETTGLSANWDAIVEIAARHIVGGQLAGPSFHRLVNPGRPIPYLASRVHGIRDQDVRTAPSLEEVLPELLAFIGSRIVVGHNIAFDLAFLRRAVRRLGLPWEPAGSICTVELSRKACPGGNHRLQEVARRLNLPPPTHRSLDDVETTARAFLNLAGQLWG